MAKQTKNDAAITEYANSLPLPEKSIPVSIGDDVLSAQPKRFKSGRPGYYATAAVTINGVRHQLTLNLTRAITKSEKEALGV